MRLKIRCFVFAVVLAALTAPAAQAEWRDYVGPSATFRQQFLGGPNGGVSGSNYWTNNRVYRPTPHPFYLDYWNDAGYFPSTTNWGTNPFYFTPSGYGTLGCFWEYYNDSAQTLYPVTCQGFV